MTRIAIVGDGFIGAGLAARLLEAGEGNTLCSLLSRSGRARALLPSAPLVAGLPALLAASPELVVEAAHPDFTLAHGCSVLARSDYLPLSLCALAQPGVLEDLLAVARRAGTRLLVPHGAVVGLDSLLAWREHWTQVAITFRKHPRHIDFGASGIDPPGRCTEVYRGPVRGIAARFPRNVNAMVACALATTGLDACEARLVADPALAQAELEIEARGADGSLLRVRRSQPASGVSGTEMAASAWRSLVLATRQAGPLAFV